MSEEYALQVGQSAAERLAVLDEIHDDTSNAFVRQLLKASPKHILDLGCGTGLTTSRFARLAESDVEIVGIDRAGDQIELARKAFKTSRIIFRVAAIDESSLDLSQYDLIYGRFVLSHNANSSQVLSNIFAQMKAGAVLAFEEPDIGSAFSIGGNGSMERAEAFYVALGKALGQDFTTGTALIRTSFNLSTNAKAKYVQPVLASRKSKRLYQLGLDEVSGRYIEHEISDCVELGELRERLLEDIRDESVYFASARIAQISLQKL